MTQYIDKSDLIAEIERRKEEEVSYDENGEFASWADQNHYSTLESIKNFIDTLEVIDPYKMWVQYASIEAGIKAYAEDYSFNIESELFNQLTEEQQILWRKEIEQACISGNYAGYQLAKDSRYKKSFEVKEVDLNEEIESYFKGFGKFPSVGIDDCIDIAKHFFELGLAQKGE